MALTKAQLIDLNGNELILDLDADTSITADTDDQIDIKIAGADDFRFTANTFTALSGSTIAAQALTATTLTTTGAIAIANDGNIGSAGDADSIAISSAGVVTFSQSPVFPDGSLAVVDLDIDGATDIGAAIVDADLFIIDDGAGGTNRKTVASRLKTYMGVGAGAFALTNLDIDGGTDIGAALVDADEIIVDDGGGGTNRRSDMSRVKTYIADVTLTTAAQTNITSLGTLTALTVDDVAIDGKVVTMTGSSNDTFVTTVAANGATSLVTTDTAAAAANLTITADGTVGINSTGDMTLDSSTDIVFDADGGDFSFKDGGTEILKISNSSSDVIIKPIVDAKDIIFQQRDGTEVARIEDNATFNVVTSKLAINGTAITSTAAEINLIDGGTSRGTDAVASGDGILINDGGTMKMTNVDTVSTYFASHTVGGGNIVTTGALGSGSIAAGFGAIDNGTSGIRSNTITAETAFVPDASGGADLGTTALEFNDAFFNDSAVINFGDDQDTTLTHTDGAGLTLNSTNKLMFNDASQFIQGSSATVLSIGATDEIDLTATAVDLNGTLNVSGVATFQATPVFPDGSLAVADLDIDGATDIGAAIVDADLFIVDDGAGGTNRKVTASRIKTYAGYDGAISTLDIDGGTDIGAALVDADEIIVDDGGGGTNRRCDMSRVKTYVGGDSTPLFSAWHNTAQTISNDTLTQVQFNTDGSNASGGAAGIDSDGKYTSNAFTPTVAGYYYIHFQTTFSVTDIEAITIAIRRNGGQAIRLENTSSSASTGQTNGFQISGMVYLDADDNVDIALYCTSDDVGLNGLASGSVVITMFQGFRLTGV